LHPQKYALPYTYAYLQAYVKKANRKSDDEKGS